jgi:hypothetical protein
MRTNNVPLPQYERSDDIYSLNGERIIAEYRDKDGTKRFVDAANKQWSRRDLVMFSDSVAML